MKNKLMKKQTPSKRRVWIGMMIYGFILVMAYPAYASAAWNPKDLFSGVIDTISYILMCIWAFLLIWLGINRKYLVFLLVFIFGGAGLSLLNSHTRDFAINAFGKMVTAFLGS